MAAGRETVSEAGSNGRRRTRGIGPPTLAANAASLPPQGGAIRTSGRPVGAHGGVTRTSAASRDDRKRALPGQCIIPSVVGSQIDSPGQYVTMTRKTSIVRSHGQTAIVNSVMPIFVMPDAT
jgi:hypothetical protein